ncbi:unnamed protein product [Pleuronectes platessa]|uniref:Immunoglobulin V-set domain-containing protein n=1 Tax=Pleuronectes platessa TaxID=8262 RepID=A0A9N7VLD5_PLEPL|nr:unnamed protein product [Pleuronectes platessa]
MTPPHLITSIITVFWIKGVYLSNEKPVFQTPADLLIKPDGEFNLSLTHQIPNYYQILWCQRSAGDSSLKLIGYVYYKTLNIEPKFSSRFNVSGNGEKTAFLQIKNLKHSEDSGEYFGAASVCLGLDIRQSPSDLVTNPAGISLGVQVHQSPSALIRKAGDAVQLVCTHGQTDYTVMLWYQQSPTVQALKLIGYVEYSQHSRDCRWFFIFNMKPPHLITSIITVFWIKGVYLSNENQCFRLQPTC